MDRHPARWSSLNIVTRVLLVISLGFLAVATIALLLTERVLQENDDDLKRQLLFLSQVVAARIDEEILTAIEELEEVNEFSDPDSPVFGSESDFYAFAQAYSRVGHFKLGLAYINSTGSVRYAYPEKLYLPGADLSGLAHIESALENRVPAISPPFVESISQKTVVSIAVPVSSKTGHSGLLVGLFELSHEKMRNLIDQAVFLDNSEHAVLVDAEGRVLYSTFDLPFLSAGEHFSFYRQAIRAGVPAVEVVPFELSLPGEPLGHLHLMAFAPVETVPWGIAIGGDVVAGGFTGRSQFFLNMALIGVVAMGGAWIATIIGTRSLLSPYKHTDLTNELLDSIALNHEPEQLTQLIAEFPSRVLPLAGSALLISEPGTGNFQLAANWNLNLPMIGAIGHAQNLYGCSDCVQAKQHEAKKLAACFCLNSSSTDWPHKSYCLLLAHGDDPIALMHLFTKPGVAVTAEHIERLDTVVPELALALEGVESHRYRIQYSEIAAGERRAIARELHDTVGQSLSYLLLKLDEFSGEDALKEIAQIHYELDRIRNITSDAYDHVRGKLKSFRQPTVPHFESVLENHAKEVGDRTGIEIRFTRQGNPQPILPRRQRQILYVYREAINTWNATRVLELPASAYPGGGMIFS